MDDLIFKKRLLLSKGSHFRDEGHHLTFKMCSSEAKGAHCASKTSRPVSNVCHSLVQAPHFRLKMSPFPSRMYDWHSIVSVEVDQKRHFQDQMAHLVLPKAPIAYRVKLFVYQMRKNRDPKRKDVCSPDTIRDQLANFKRTESRRAE
jgi:hypothetical protein